MMKGHSNFNVELVKYTNGYFVKKSTKTPNIRLKNQIQKQIEFKMFIEKNEAMDLLFEIPSVIEEREKYFIMDFYNGKSILDIFEKGDITLLNEIIDKLIRFINWEFENCIYTKDVRFEIIEKLSNVKSRDIKVSCLIDKLIKKLPKEIKIPIGMCHGDLTLSNLIFTERIVLIDFLDSYIETPLQDIAKLLQEIMLEWSLLINNNKRDNIKIKIAYKYLREQLFSKLLSYSEHSRLFYIITLFRLFPYIVNENIYKRVLSEIEKELE